MARGVRRGTRGFTLIEVVIVLAILSIIVAMLAPMAFQLFTAERSTALENELQEIYRAIVGDPEKNVFGYVGDVGNYPKSLLDLIRQPLGADSVTPLPGWKGPYLQNPRIENNVWIDPLSRPYEYYLVNGSQGVPDQLAIISRGTDGLSTNSTMASWVPNAFSTYQGADPADSGSATGSNADNVSFPRVDPNNPNALNVKTDGDVALNIQNWDNNSQINTWVPACPQLYTITATSVARGTVEASTYFAPGLAFNLAQGQYRIAITPQGLTTTSWTETITVMPGTTLTRSLNLSGLDSSGTPQYNLTVKNGFSTTELEVYEFNNKLSGYLPGQSTGAKSYVDEGETRVFAVRACAQVYIKQKSSSTVKDQFVMPYGAFSRQLGKNAATLVVINLCCHTHHDHGNSKIHHHDDDNHHHHGHHRLFVYRYDILIGTVNHHHKSKEFKDLTEGDKITIYDKFGTLKYTNNALGVGTTTATITN